MADRFPSHPEAMTDPLAEPPAAAPASAPRQAWGQANPPPPPEPHPEPVLDDGLDIQRGMPKKGLKTALGLVALALVGGFLFWPEESAMNKPAPTIPVLPPQPPMAAIIKEGVPPAPPVPETPAPPVEMLPRSAASDLQELVLSSKMEADEVQLDGPRNAEELAAQQQANGRAAGPAGADDPDDLIKRAMANGEKMVDRILAAETAGQEKPIAQARNSQEAFLEESAKRQPLPVEQLQPTRPRGTLYQGAIIRLVLDGAMRSDAPGEVHAGVVSDVYDSVHFRDLLIPRGSKVDCRYQSAILVGQSRIIFACERIRLPNGKYIKLPGNPAGDMWGASGVPAKVDTQFFNRFGSVLMMGMASTLLPSEDRTTTVTSNAGGTSQASTVLGSTLNQVITQTLSRNASIGPTGYIEAGSIFTVTTIADLQLEPYQGRAGGAR